MSRKALQPPPAPHGVVLPEETTTTAAVVWVVRLSCVSGLVAAGVSASRASSRYQRVVSAAFVVVSVLAACKR